MNVVKTKYGYLEGLEKEGYSLFAGIPYAKPPVGALRWKAPQPVDAWEGVREAKAFQNRSMQDVRRTAGFYDKEFYDEGWQTPVSEDGLYLNIWTPAKEAGEKLPVAFWIHGGAFTGGFGHEKEFDGEGYCKRGVILVTINYRLGVFGFLAHPELSAESGNHISGNYGILDQIAALEWVYENIAAFGGNPENITVFGQSAGCMSVRTLVSSDLTGNKINRAILQSGLGLSADKTLREAEEEGMELQRMAGASGIADLRAIDAATLQTYSKQLADSKGMGALIYTPVIDGYVMKDGYDQALREGKIKDISYMAGCTGDDIDRMMGPADENGHGLMYHGVCDWAVNQEKLGRKPAYVYYFTRQLPGDDAGAFHSSELWYMFETWKRCWRPFTKEDSVLSAHMMDAWTNFMKTGNPNAGGKGDWKPYTTKQPYVQIFDID